MNSIDQAMLREIVHRNYDELLAELVAVRAERDDLRDAIRLMIGMDTNTPWPDVRQSDVDGWLERIRQLKADEMGVKFIDAMRQEIADLKAKLADSEREREALQKAHDLLNAGFESATEQMHDLKQAVRSLEAKLAESESIRRMLTTDLGKMLNDERAARLKAEAACAALTAACEWVISTPEGYKLVAESAENPNVWVEEGGDDLRVSTDAGQHVIDYIAAARRLREAQPTMSHPGGELVKVVAYYWSSTDWSSQTIDGRLVAERCADVDAAEAKLTGGTA